MDFFFSSMVKLFHLFFFLSLFTISGLAGAEEYKVSVSGVESSGKIQEIKTKSGNAVRQVSVSGCRQVYDESPGQVTLELKNFLPDEAGSKLKVFQLSAISHIKIWTTSLDPYTLIGRKAPS